MSGQIEIMNGDFVPVARADLAMAQIDHEGVVYDERRGSWHHLNQTAMLIWQLCDGSVTIDQLGDEIVELYNGDPESVRSEVAKSVRQLGALGLLEGVEVEDPVPALNHQHSHHDPGEIDLGPHILPVPPSS